MDDALALERFGEPADLVHETTSRNRGVVRKRLMSGVDELQHGLSAFRTVERSREYSPGGLAQAFLEAEPRSFPLRPRADLDAVGDRPDDRDAEPPFGKLVRRPFGRFRIEAFAFVDHLDDEPIGKQEVGDLDDAGVLSVRVPDRI